MLSVVAAANGAPDGGWSNLYAVTHKRGYRFIRKDGGCINGSIQSVSADAVHVLEWDWTGRRTNQIALHRGAIVRIVDGGTGAHDAIFSGRSSWTDVEAAAPGGQFEHLLVVTADGRQHIAKNPVITRVHLTISGADKVDIPKSEIRQVFYVRLKPLTANTEYLGRENAALLAPNLWFGGVFLGTIPVLLYDSSKPEDNSMIRCSSVAASTGYRITHTIGD
jgi:hypothetical protein